LLCRQVQASAACWRRSCGSLAESIANHLRLVKGNDVRHRCTCLRRGAERGWFFYLGQQHQAIAPCVVYEYDFDRRGNKSYQPSMIMD